MAISTTEQGKADGFEAVQDFLTGGGSGERLPDRKDLYDVAYGSSAEGWDTAAINAGCARIVGIPAGDEELERAYYEAYQAEALRAAREAYDAGPG